MIIRTCKYGHGELYKDDAFWAFNGVTISNALIDSKEGTEERSVVLPIDHAYVLNILKCKTCGYIELMDFEVDNDND